MNFFLGNRLPILKLFEKNDDLIYKGPKDLESLEFFVKDKLMTANKKVGNQ